MESLLQKRVTRPSLSPYASAVVLVSKKYEGLTYLSLDYFKGKAITVTDDYPIPRMDELIEDVDSSTILPPWTSHRVISMLE